MNTLRLQLVALSLFAAPGCAMNGDKVAVESELRNKEATIRHLEKRVTESERMLADQDREIETLRSTTVGHTKAAKPGKDSPITFSNVSSTTETSTAWGSVTSVRIHTLTSGIVKDPDGETQSLNVVLQPLDDDNELVKVAATITLTASTVKPDGTTSPLITKTFDLTESRRLWSRGLVSSGFHILMPMDAEHMAALSTDSSAKLLIHASIELSPERIYTTSELITPRG